MGKFICNKMTMLTGMILLAFLLSGCGAGKKAQNGDPSGEGEAPLTVEAGQIDLDALEGKTAGAIQGADGYYLQESVCKSAVSEAEWDKALEPFREQLGFRMQDTSYAFEGRDEFEYSIQGMFRDEQGYSYVMAGKTLLMIDPDGKIAVRKDYGTAGDELDYFVGDPILSDAGEVVFPIRKYEDHTVELVSFNRQTGKERSLGVMEDQLFRNPLCALRGSKLFYRSNDWIVSWDLLTGERARFFDLKSAGTGDRSVMVGFDAEGVPLLYIGGKIASYQYITDTSDEEIVVVLSSEPVETQLTIRINDLVGEWDNFFVASIVGAYQVTRPDIYLDYQKYEDEKDREDYRSRAMAEIISGKSADIICVNRDDLCTLWRKGLISDVEEIVSRDTLDEILPAALELGMVDGDLAGIVPLGYASGLGTSAENCAKGSWTMREFMDQVKAQGKKYAWTEHEGRADWSYAYDLMRFSGIPSLEGLGLIDYQKHTANLDSEGYIELLEFCKEYSMTKDLSEEEYEECRENGESMAFAQGFIYSFTCFDFFYKVLGHDCKLAGFPGGDGSCNYFNSVKWLAVSKQAAEDPQKREEVAAFLEYLLSEEGQSNIRYYLGVRKPTDENCYDEKEGTTEDIERSSMVGIDISSMARMIICMGRQEAAVALKEDGTTHLRDYMEFMENCKARPYATADIEKIIMEEAGRFFQGEASAEEVARVTQNRVQLYLNETK